jgi:hypothetical protein
MDRTNGAGHINHRFAAENPATNQPPTEVTADWLNGIQEELIGIIVAAGIAPVSSVLTQLKQALDILYGAGMSQAAADARYASISIEDSVQITDWNAVTKNGTYWSAPAPFPAPPNNAPNLFHYFMGVVEVHNQYLWQTQTVTGFVIDGEADTQTFRRSMNNGVWEAWYKLQLSQAEQDARYAAIGSVGAGGLGIGQTWIAVVRSFNVNYVNNTGNPIELSASITCVYGTIQVTVNSVILYGSSVTGTGGLSTISCVIPVGGSYSIGASGTGPFTFVSCNELR